LVFYFECRRIKKNSTNFLSIASLNTGIKLTAFGNKSAAAAAAAALSN
jgi:hypothetical protein